MRLLIKIVLSVLWSVAVAWGHGRQAIELTGAGSSFIYPVMVRWTTTYYQNHQVRINYQSIGSGGGIRQLASKTIDFAASDEPLTDKQLAERKWQQYPMVHGAIVPIVNIVGIHNGQLVLSGSLLAEIYLGAQRYWDSPKIRALNPTLPLPHKRIIPVYRSDGSGTSYNFSHYLSKVSPMWAEKVGYSTVLNWPAGIGGKGNAGVAGQVEQLENSIGYVEYAFIQANHKLTSIRIKNRHGERVAPTIETFKAGFMGPTDRSQAANTQSHSKVWPIMATTFVILPAWLSVQKRERVYQFLTWCYQSGGQMAEPLGYVPISSETYQKIIANWTIRR